MNKQLLRKQKNDVQKIKKTKLYITIIYMVIVLQGRRTNRNDKKQKRQRRKRKI